MKKIKSKMSKTPAPPAKRKLEFGTFKKVRIMTYSVQGQGYDYGVTGNKMTTGGGKGGNCCDQC